MSSLSSTSCPCDEIRTTDPAVTVQSCSEDVLTLAFPLATATVVPLRGSWITVVSDEPMATFMDKVRTTNRQLGRPTHVTAADRSRNSEGAVLNVVPALR